METTIATKDMWKRLPMEEPKTIAFEMRFDEEQFQKIKMGIIPDEMEDKWFVYYEDGWLYCHRSWTGCMFFVAQIEKEDDTYVIREFFVERKTEIYTNKDDESDRGIFEFLIKQGLLGIDARLAFFKSQEMTEFGVFNNWSLFGRMLFREDDEQLNQELNNARS